MASPAWKAWPSTCSLHPFHHGAGLAGESMHINFLHLGRISYTEGLRMQAEVVAARKAGVIADTLLLLEHPPVLTLGRNASRANILATDEELAPKELSPRNQSRR